MWTVCSDVYLCAWGQRPEENGLLYYFLLYGFETESLTDPGPLLVVNKPQQSSHISLPAMGLQAYVPGCP